MIPRELIGTAKVPGGVELKLIRHGEDHVIMVDANELMSSRLGGSEEALAVMACQRLKKGIAPRLLIGGYGMGFTLRAALQVIGPEGRATVAELVPEIIDWAKGPMAKLTDGCLDDPRVELIQGDVLEAMKSASKRYDAILLDVDNGPSGLVRPDNNGLYSMSGLARAKAALRPGGVLAIWSAAPDERFTKKLRDAGFKAEMVTVRARSNGKGPRHTIWFAAIP
jgi:spermidine synthase